MKMQIDACRKGSIFILVSTEGNTEEEKKKKESDWSRRSEMEF